jgi:ketosteroid isomerase-like protein
MAPMSKMDRLRAIARGFDTHDVDAIMEHFVEDCVFESPRGPEAYGQRFVGREQVRAAFEGRFAGLPDVRYTDDEHFVCGDRGVSQWLLTGTTTAGEPVEVRGCDIWTFRDGHVLFKDSYWKIRTT